MSGNMNRINFNFLLQACMSRSVMKIEVGQHYILKLNQNGSIKTRGVNGGGTSGKVDLPSNGAQNACMYVCVCASHACR